MSDFIEGDFRSIVGGDNANNRFSSSAVVGNVDGSIIERMEALQCGQPSVLVPGLGFRVTKTENMNTATGVDLFTITGKVLINLWTFEVTNALDAAINDYKIRVKTDNVDLFIATDLAAAAIGTLFLLPGQFTTKLNGAATAGVKVAAMSGENDSTVDRTQVVSPYVVGLAGGSCTLQSLRTAGASGDEVVHMLFYYPLEAAASISAV